MRYFRCAEVAERFKVSPQTVRNWCRDGKLRYIQTKRTIRIPEESLDDFQVVCAGGVFLAPESPREKTRISQKLDKLLK